MAFVKPAISLVGATFSGLYARMHLNKNHGPQSNHPKVGQKIEVDGKVKVVVGYFGAACHTFNNIDYNRALYFGRKAQAQGYALNRAKAGAQPKVGVVVADRLPTHEHFEMGRFDGAHLPLSPEGNKDLDVRVIHPEPVNKHTKVGVLADLKRFFASKTATLRSV